MLNKYWQDIDIPCLHRLHASTPNSGAHKIQASLGMSYSLDELRSSLKNFVKNIHKKNIKTDSDKKAIISFDDGHRDILLAIPILKDYPEIQPVLFITGNLMNGDTRALPLTALYKWCADNKRHPNSLREIFDFDRKSLKLLPEKQQRQALEKEGIDVNPSSERMVSQGDIDILLKNGWLIGYHGPEHFDLCRMDFSELKKQMQADLKLIKNLGYAPWLAWPEGSWNKKIVKSAADIGFKLQFGLDVVKIAETNSLIINRVLWK